MTWVSWVSSALVGAFAHRNRVVPPSINIDAIQEQHMEVYIRVERRSKPLNQRDRTSVSHLVGLPSLFDQVCCDDPVDNTEYPTHDLRTAGK